MFASLHATPLASLLALLEPAANDGSDSTLWSALAGLALLVAVFWAFSKWQGTEAEAPRSRRSMPAPASARRRSEAPVSRRIPRRVIRLHAVTPGQSRYEYNVGDDSGTRGTALARLA